MFTLDTDCVVFRKQQLPAYPPHLGDIWLLCTGWTSTGTFILLSRLPWWSQGRPKYSQRGNTTGCILNHSGCLGDAPSNISKGEAYKPFKWWCRVVPKLTRPPSGGCSRQPGQVSITIGWRSDLEKGVGWGKDRSGSTRAETGKFPPDDGVWVVICFWGCRAQTLSLQPATAADKLGWCWERSRASVADGAFKIRVL